MANGDIKIVQGVRELFEIFDAPTQREEGQEQEKETSESKASKMVIIGRHLEDFDLKGSLLQTLSRR